MANILEAQNINNLQDGFTTAKHNPFPVSETEEAEPYWGGYAYAPDGLGTTFKAQTGTARVDTQGKEMFVDGSGEAQYGPVGRMSNSQTSILNSLANQSAARSPRAFPTGAPARIKETFKKTSALRSANITGTMGPGGQKISSGTPVKENTSQWRYGGGSQPEVRVEIEDGQMTVDGQDLSEAAADFSMFGDRNSDNVSDLADFFKWADEAKVTEEGDITVLTTGGEFIMNTSKGMSGGVGMEGLLKTA